MEILQIVGLAMVAAVLAVILKQDRPEFALQISILTGIIIFTVMLTKITAVINVIQGLANRADIDEIYFNTILKIIGISYITEFGAQVCRDAGSTAIASKVEFAGKIIILVLAVPIIVALMDLVLGLIP
jgi:stage III sporulation protein AD